jgi:putative ABC transport system ATP-binding protein
MNRASTDLVLSLDSVQFRYPGAKSPPLEIGHLALKTSDRLLVKGPSGCGKSTLLSLAAGVLLPQAGQVRLLGSSWQDLRPADRDARRVDHVGYIFQQFNLLPYLSVVDNVLLPCRFSTLRSSRAQATHGSESRAAQSLLNSLGLDPSMWNKDAARLSVGQQQRVAAARALIGQPELVIADEPTSALDEGWRDAFMKLLIEHCDRHRSALLFVSHDSRLSQYFGTCLNLPSEQQTVHTEGASS